MGLVKKIFNFVRLIIFIPLGFSIGFYAQSFLIDFIRSETFAPIIGYWTYWDIFYDFFGWIVAFYSAYLIKPKFINPKKFIIAIYFGIILHIKSIFLDLIANEWRMWPNPLYRLDFSTEKLTNIFSLVVIPVFTLFLFIKNKTIGLYSLERRRNK